MDFENENENVLEEDYYTFLNVSREATNEEISNAYRRLSRLYHPDKHPDPEHKKKAEHLFNKTKRAYEVLSDPHLRAIYDNVGIRGLETEGWQIVPRTRTPNEIRAEYERLARERAERQLQQRTNPKGSITVNIRATDLFNRLDEQSLEYATIDDSTFLPSIEISGMNFSQSVELPLTLRNTATLSGQLGTQNGTGGGSINLSCRHLLSERGYVEMEVGAGHGPVMSLKGFRTLTRHLFCNGGVVMHFSSQYASGIGIRPGLFGTMAMQLDKHTVGYLTYRAGIQSCMSTTVVRETESYQFNFTVLFGIPHSYVSTQYTKKMLARELKLRLAFKLGTFGAIVEYGVEKKVSKHSTLSTSVAVGVPTGVILKIKFTRANQIYIFPIHLCDEILLSPIFYATVTPLITYTVVRKLIVEPYLREREEEHRLKQREANRKKIAEKRREALAAIELMRATFERIRNEEQNRNGLIIVKALYGKLVANDSSNASSGDASGERAIRNEDEIIDVTIPLQCLVKDSRLVLHESSKSQLPGFYDPCVGDEKMLNIQYLFRTSQHEVTISDTEPLRIPKQSHRVNGT